MECCLNPKDIIARLKYIFNFKTGRLLDREGNQSWWFHWSEHRDDGLPAYEGKNGTKKYYKFGDLHREGDQAAIEWADGGREFYKLGKRHRDNGPAVIRANGDKEYYQNDKLHRLDGPAREYADGKVEYWRDGQIWEEGKKEAQRIRREERVKQEFTEAAKEAEKVETNIQALKDAKTKKPPPSLKNQ